MKILVIGAGATGGYFGGRLSQAGRDVTFLVRPKRAEQIAAEGLQLVSPHGDVTLHPPTVTAGTLAGPYDVILLSVKAYGLDAVMDDFAPAVGPDTMIFPVLNGMKHIDTLTLRFGAGPVLGGVCLVATTIDPAGRIVQMAPMQELIYGELDGSITPRVQALDAAIKGAGFEAKLSPTILQAMWEKWVFLATLGGITCLLRGTIGDIAAAPGGADLALRMRGEAAAVATAAGYPPSEAMLTRTGGALTAAGSPLASSMYRDMRNGGAVEVEQILGDLVARAKGFGVDAPLLGAAYANLSVYEAGRLKS